MSVAISLVIPTFNFVEYLDSQWASLEAAGLLEVVDEIVFVNDGSTDATAAKLLELQTNSPSLVRIVTHERNLGRFLTRLHGAEAANGSRVLFMDARITLDADFGVKLKPLAEKFPNLMAIAEIDVTKSIFNLYWQRTHEMLFAKSYREQQGGITITPENFDQYGKGTTTVCLDRQMYLRAASKFLANPPLNDDNPLLLEIAREQPIRVDPGFRVWWEPRQGIGEFLRRLYERGPSFVEFHIFTRPRIYFAVTLIAIAYLVCILALVLVNPVMALVMGGVAVLGVILSTLFFSKSPREFVRLLLLHLMVVLTFGAGVLRGIVLHLLGRRTTS